MVSKGLWIIPAQLLNCKGEEIYYPVVDDRDRSWVRRLEWAINHHRDLAQSVQDECELVLRRSQSAAKAAARYPDTGMDTSIRGRSDIPVSRT